ncbi:MAG: hypothetical protein PHP53_16465 [Prolixibacteraceae bacterium]|nr:hypothetical protein [Prolixibacteraceae bacterium]
MTTSTIITIALAIISPILAIILPAYLKYYKIDNAKIVSSFNNGLHFFFAYILPITSSVIGSLYFPFNKLFVLLIAMNTMSLSVNLVVEILKLKDKADEKFRKGIYEVIYKIAESNYAEHNKILDITDDSLNFSNVSLKRLSEIVEKMADVIYKTNIEVIEAKIEVQNEISTSHHKNIE